MVHSKNWAVYTFFNEKARRTEVVSLEMYEGKEQSNATTFSSIDSQVIPLVERQAYILPLDIVALEETMTTKDITKDKVKQVPEVIREIDLSCSDSKNC